MRKSKKLGINKEATHDNDKHCIEFWGTGGARDDTIQVFGYLGTQGTLGYPGLDSTVHICRPAGGICTVSGGMY
jgi:hypothetical protein